MATSPVIDWHNFGFSILGLRLGPTHPLVRISKTFEQVFSSKAYAHLVVSKAMKRVLKEDWKLMGPVLPLYDRPFDYFYPLGESQRFEFLAQCPETAFAVDGIRRGTTKMLISSTSWTADEDFSLLLDALKSYSDMAAPRDSCLPQILAIITGKGPLKDAFIAKIRTATTEGTLNSVQIRTAWLSSEDYPKLLASADLGVSLHTSSSGVDLPMKVVDMLGAGLPVIGWDKFEAWPELIQEGINGRGFRSSVALSGLLVALFGDDAQQLQRLRQGALDEGKRRWEDDWILVMLADVKLPFHPTATDCLAWSEDGELAIAAGEFVHILIPRRGSHRDQQNASKPDPWVHISFRINTYTVSEWPTQELDDLDSFCVGEEQSSSTVIALSWSSVGLAKHKRSALAVLATNHVLSLWASMSDMKTASAWERVLLVNNALGTPDQRITPQGEGTLTSFGILRRSARIQSMSWAPIKPDNSAHYKTDLQSATSESYNPIHYLAVTNDTDEVVILLIHSRWTHHRNSLWEAQIVSRGNWQDLRLLFSSSLISRTEEGHSQTEWPSVVARSFSKKTFIDRVVCTPCRNHQAGLGLILHKGWETLQLDISWLAYSSLASGNVVLHASGLLSGSSIFPVASNPNINEQPLDHFSSPIQSPLSYQVQMLQKDFDQHHDLGGLSIAKTWGLASWGPYVASCISFHPGDMVEYTMTSGERCHIIFSLMDEAGVAVEDADFPWQELSFSPHERDNSDVHQKVLTILTNQQLYSSLDCRVFYAKCCAVMIRIGTQNTELVGRALQQLATSTGVNLELELGLLRATRDSPFLTASCIERLNEITTARGVQEDGLHWKQLYDFCSICDEIVIWTSVTEASCAAGHHFGMLIAYLQPEG
ncbi:MAG: hypothetical protein Q9216_000174 [Gyalolechia sp. 2 TL-2023]